MNIASPQTQQLMQEYCNLHSIWILAYLSSEFAPRWHQHAIKEWMLLHSASVSYNSVCVELQSVQSPPYWKSITVLEVHHRTGSPSPYWKSITVLEVHHRTGSPYVPVCARIHNMEHFQRLCGITRPEVMHWPHKNYNSGCAVVINLFWYASSAIAAAHNDKCKVCSTLRRRDT